MRIKLCPHPPLFPHPDQRTKFWRRARPATFTMSWKSAQGRHLDDWSQQQAPCLPAPVPENIRQSCVTCPLIEQHHLRSRTERLSGRSLRQLLEAETVTPDWGPSYFHVHPVSGRRSCRNYHPRGEHERYTAICTCIAPWNGRLYVISSCHSLSCNRSTCFHIETRDVSWMYCNSSRRHACDNFMNCETFLKSSAANWCNVGN